jgi:queuine/archaeosine tRNA-ribosyltransferase
LVALAEPQFLVSAYDISYAGDDERSRLNAALARARDAGAIVLLDSGNYESFWHNQQAAWTPADFGRVLAATAEPLAFVYDDQRPSEDVESAVGSLLAGLERDQSSTSTATVCPIVHGPTATLDARVRLVAERRQPLLLAVAERELGAGLIERARTVRRLRRALDEVAPACALHLLGTGNPLAILAFAIAGAQSFDGLEWCQTCVDPETAWLHHFQHRDLVRPTETALGPQLPYVEATLVHNLVFFRQWMRRVREALATGAASQLLEAHLPPGRRSEVLSSLESRG